MTYSRFFAMIATSTVVMFILMYLNTYALDHVSFSETRVYMAIVMGACINAVHPLRSRTSLAPLQPVSSPEPVPG